MMITRETVCNNKSDTKKYLHVNGVNFSKFCTSKHVIEKKRKRGEKKKDGKVQFKNIFGINSNYLSV